MQLELRLTLQSDATFGRGDGVAGLVDLEVEHDAATGLPFLRGRTLKGLLTEECANLLYALKGNTFIHETLSTTAGLLFGSGGSGLVDDGWLRVGPALLPQSLRDAVEADVKAGRLTPTDVLESLTDIRRQTAIQDSGAPDTGSLRSMRVVLRETTFIAALHITDRKGLSYENARALLAACALGLRRGGLGRNRGRGRLSARLCDEAGNDITSAGFRRLRELVEGKVQ